MRWLKWKPLQIFEQENRAKNILYLSGVRQLESERRFGNVQPLSIDGKMWFAAPIWKWPDDKVWDYFKQYNIPRSPAYEHLNISGDCNCGAFGTPEEFFIYEAVYPQIADRIKNLQEEVKYSCLLKQEYKTWGNKKKKKEPLPPQQNAICAECAYRF